MSLTGFIFCATTRALAIPEVADLIFDSGYLSRSDLANICQVSRYMFSVGTPLLWRNPAAEDLFGLIESAEFYCRLDGTLHSIVLDAYIVDPETFDRFHSYAHHVQSLEIYDRKSHRCYTVEGWNTLRTEMAVRGRALLPNLKTLRFLNTSPSHGMDEMEWLEIFAAEGVEDIFLAPNRSSPSGQIPFPIASTILETLVTYCPRIRRLALASSDDSWSVDTAKNRFFAALSYHPTRPWYQELQCLTRLRHLTISEGWFYPASLQALGSLPVLESLTIVSGKFEDFDYMFDTSPNLPDGSFPGLRKLSIFGLEEWGIGTILEVGGMLRQVTTMKLEFYFEVCPGDTEGEYYSIQRIFDGIHRVPRLQELHICYPFSGFEGEPPAKLYNLIEDMGPHPSLEFIYLDGLRIQKEYRRRDPRSILGLPRIWPNVRVLSMPCQHTSFRELEDFANLSSLRHLTVKLKLKNPHIPEKPKSEPAALKTLVSSGPVRLSTVYSELTLSAHSLLLLWPSLERVTWSDEDPGRMQLAEFFNSEVLPFTRQFLFGTPRNKSRFSAAKRAKEMKGVFKLIVEEVEVVDTDSDSDSEVEP